MQIDIKYTGIEPTERLTSLILEKIGGLEKFVGKRKEFRVWVEVARTTLHHREGKVWYAEAQIRFLGKSLRATATHDSLLTALDEVKEELGQILKKTKEKKKAQETRKALNNGSL